ncbi:shikimate kinase [Exiguobacterium sp. B2(2022)]|uniref:shikimate kinase n=1 Tax=Exiguobacterium sp. B2(2022) TaxID=2992755 RepID=UPI00237A0B33|nr:shikimate kinase [Exiguobacterium sp. B2(2022)]MDE0563643.1 shikimate kinase [Exiguobacterium sp. B2(2022)]
MNKKPFYIVGFMGTGKSTLFTFMQEHGDVVDLDEEIEALIGTDIATYFDQYGESAFRDVESKVLQRIDADFVLTGGGIVERSENIRWMRERGKIIHLDLPFEECWARIKDSDRPLVKKGESEVRALYNRRTTLYQEADETVDASQTPQCIAEQIIRMKEEKV